MKGERADLAYCQGNPAHVTFRRGTQSFRGRYHARWVDVLVEDDNTYRDWLSLDHSEISETRSDEKQLERDFLGNQYGGLTLLLS